MYTLFVVLIVLIALLMIFIVLIQESREVVLHPTSLLQTLSWVFVRPLM